MKRVLLAATVLVALMAWWMVREEGGARAAHNSDSSRENPAAVGDTLPPSESDATSDPVELPSAPDAVVLTGKVIGPDGPVWGIRIQIHPHGKSVAFDETQTRTDGTFRLEFAVVAGGEMIDISARPEPRSKLMGERLEGIMANPGSSLTRVFTLGSGGVIRGTVAGLSVAYSRTPARIVVVRYADWLSRASARPVPLAVQETRTKFRFTQLGPGRYVVTCESPGYIALDPPVVEPGGDSVVLRLAYAPKQFVTIRDLTTLELLPNARVEVLGFGPDEPLTRARGTADRAGFWARLRWDGRSPHRLTLLRVQADGYHPLEYAALPISWSRGSLDVRLVPIDSPQLTLRFGGGGARLMAMDLQVTAQIRVRPGTAATSYRSTRRIVFPTLAHTQTSRKLAIPPGEWELVFQGRERLMGGSVLFPISIPPEGTIDVTLNVPEPAIIELDPSGVGGGFRQMWVRGVAPHWVETGAGEYLLQQGQGGTPGGFAIFGQSPFERVSPGAVPLFPGTWILAQGSRGGGTSTYPVVLTPGVVTRVQLHD